MDVGTCVTTRAFWVSEYTCGRKDLGCSQGLEVTDMILIVTHLSDRGACLWPEMF